MVWSTHMEVGSELMQRFSVPEAASTAEGYPSLQTIEKPGNAAGHEYDVSGVFATNPKDAPGPVLFRESVLVGHTQMSPQRVQQAVQEMGEQYKGNAYHLLQRNCNHFSNDLCVKLTGQPAPLWINRLAGMAVMLHCLIPTAWVPPLSPPTASPVLGPEPVHVDVHQEERQGLLSPSDRQRLHSKDAWPAQEPQLQREALHT
ncbi:TPA: hypothetical protein ACH3X2_002933 [Trebouxia sp. C0005]